MPQTEQQRQNAFQAAGYNPPTTPTGLPTISSENLADTPSLNIPPTPPQRDYSGIIDAGLQSIQQGFNAPSQEETDVRNVSDLILSVQQKLGGQSAKKQQLEKEAGLPGQRQDLQNVINQLQGLQKEAQAIPLQIQEEFKGVGATTGGAAPIQASRLRENAIKALGLAAIGQTFQGNISLAEQSIERQLDAIFEPERIQLDVLKQAYEFNKDALERIDKKRADNLNIVLRERERLLSENREDEKNKLELITAGATNSANPAPADVIEKARNAATPLEAMKYLYPYLSNPLEKEAQLTDIAARRASTALAYQNIEDAKLGREKTRAEIEKIKSETGEKTTLTKQKVSELLDSYTLSNEILNDPNLSIAIGKSSVLDPRNYIPGSNVQLVKNKINQLTSLLSLESRQKLKGSGQISDYESRILAQAATALGTNLSDEAFGNELRKIRGIFATSAGLDTIVVITDPKTGQKKVGAANKDTIESAVASGYTIEYK